MDIAVVKPSIGRGMTPCRFPLYSLPPGGEAFREPSGYDGWLRDGFSEMSRTAFSEDIGEEGQFRKAIASAYDGAYAFDIGRTGRYGL